MIEYEKFAEVPFGVLVRGNNDNGFGRELFIRVHHCMNTADCWTISHVYDDGLNSGFVVVDYNPDEFHDGFVEVEL